MRIGQVKSLIMMATGFGFLLTPGIAHAAFLYWASPQVKTTSVPVCFQFARDAMYYLNFQNIQQKQSEVTGTSGGVYASITCLQTSPNATAVVMAVGENDSQTAKVRDDLSKEVSGIINID